MTDDPISMESALAGLGALDLPKVMGAEYRRGVLDGWNLAAEIIAEGHPLVPVFPPDATTD